MQRDKGLRRKDVAPFRHGSKTGHSSGVADVDARRRRPRSDADAPGARWLSPAWTPSHPALVTHEDPRVEPCLIRHGSNAGHSSGVAQGQRSLNRCSGSDFQHEVFAPTATAAFHSQTVAAGMLLQQPPTRRVLCYATAKLLRDEAESMVPNIDPEQVRKLAGWGLTQNDRASFVGWCPQPSAVGPVPHQPGFLIVLRP